MATEEQSPTEQVAEVQGIDNQEIGSQETEDETLSPSEEPLDEPFDELPAEAPPPGEELLDELSLDDTPSGEDPPATPTPDADKQSEPGNQGEQQTTTPQLNDLEELPVELLFVIDQFKTTLKEVEQIKPDYVFELDGKIAGHVEIRANGAAVGSGDLVQIEGRAGVRVIELYNKKTDT